MNPSFTLGSALVATLLTFSCSMTGLELSQVELEVPPIPPSWAGLGGIELFVVWRDVEGLRHRIPARPNSIVSIELPKGIRRPIFVEAWYRGRPLKPAGALWPDDLLRSPGLASLPKLKARWFEGWMATIVSGLDDSGVDRGIDFPRLDAEARARLPDPWLVDPQAVILAIRNGEFRSDSLKATPALPLVLPTGGPWFAESPFPDPPRPSAEGWVTMVAPGFHRWYSKDLELFAALPDEGESVMLLRALE